MKNLIKKYIVFQLMFGLATFCVHAQDDWEEGGIKDAQLVIEKNRVLELARANRNFDRMTKIEVQQQTTQQEYITRHFNLPLPALAPQIKPLKMKTTPMEKLYSNYVKAGFGNYVTPYLEGFFNSNRSERYSYSAHLKHLSSARGPVDGRNSGNSFNEINLNGKYFMGAGSLSGGLQYERRGLHFYGYDANRFEPDRDSIRQVFNAIDLKIGYESARVDSKLNYGINTSYYHFWDRYQARESQFGINFNSRMRFSDDASLTTLVDVAILGRRDSVSVGRNLVTLFPSYNQRLGKLNFSIGARIVYSGEPEIVYNGDTTLHKNNQFRVYPVLSASYDVIADKITAYAGIQGMTQKTTLRSFTQENPFLAANVPLLHTNQQVEFSAGIRGNVLRKIGFNVRAAYGQYKNLYFYGNDPRDSSRFLILYDRKSIPVLNLTGELSATTADVRVLLKSEVYHYGTRTLERAWHRPTLKNTLSTTYHYRDKVFVNFDIFNLAGIRAKNFFTDTDYKLKPIIDLNLKVDYHFSPFISAFVSGNNLLSQKYQRYLYYDSRGFNVLAGVTFAF